MPLGPLLLDKPVQVRQHSEAGDQRKKDENKIDAAFLPTTLIKHILNFIPSDTRKLNRYFCNLTCSVPRYQLDIPFDPKETWVQNICKAYNVFKSSRTTLRHYADNKLMIEFKEAFKRHPLYSNIEVDDDNTADDVDDAADAKKSDSFDKKVKSRTMTVIDALSCKAEKVLAANRIITLCLTTGVKFGSCLGHEIKYHAREKGIKRRYKKGTPPITDDILGNLKGCTGATFENMFDERLSLVPLKCLALRNVKIIPKEIGKFNAVALTVHNSTPVPCEIWEIKNLRSVLISLSVEVEGPKKEVPNLEILKLGKIQKESLEKFPFNLFPNLIELNINCCDLDRFPDMEMKRLTSLQISSTKITQLPENFLQRFPKLKELVLYGNQLMTECPNLFREGFTIKFNEE